MTVWQDARDPNRAPQCYKCWQYTDVTALTIHPGSRDATDKFYCDQCMPDAKMWFTEQSIKWRTDE
jgi:hypothetical protein